MDTCADYSCRTKMEPLGEDWLQNLATPEQLHFFEDEVRALHSLHHGHDHGAA